MNYNFYNLQHAETVNAALDALPVAKFVPLLRADTSTPIVKKGIVVGDECVNVVSDRYALVQHKEVFRPIIEALVLSGVQNFDFNMWHDSARASMNVYVGEAEDGVKFGFNARNCFDGKEKVNVAYSAYQKRETVEIVEKEHVLVWGLRQVCSNGMIIRFPLKSTKYLDAVKRTQIKELLHKSQSIKHMRGVIATQLPQIQYVVEAMMLLKGPLNMMILDAQKYRLTPDMAKSIIQKYVGQRKIDRMLENYRQKQGNDLWALYNSVTFYASHEVMSETRRHTLLLKASNLLTGELLA